MSVIVVVFAAFTISAFIYTDAVNLLLKSSQGSENSPYLGTATVSPLVCVLFSFLNLHLKY